MKRENETAGPSWQKRKKGGTFQAQPSVGSEWLSSYKEAKDFHEQGIKGNKKAVKSAHSLLEQLTKEIPNHIEAKAYLGSVTALLARDTPSVQDKMKYALEGLKLLDEAVQQAGDDINIRLLRANVCHRLPEVYFHKTETAIKDFEYLLDRYKKDETLLQDEVYKGVLKNLSEAYKTKNRTEEASEIKALLQSFKSKPELTKSEPESPVIKMDLPNAKVEPVEVQEPVQIPKTASQSTSTFVMSEEGQKLYDRAVLGDANAVKQALNYFSAEQDAHPDDPLLEAYEIDCMSMVGRDSTNTFDMFGSAIKGMKALDALVDEYPDNHEIRLIRAMQSFRLPEIFFRRTVTAVKDFEHLLQQNEQGGNFLSEEKVWDILYKLGEGNLRLALEDDARKAWNKLLSLRPSEKYKNLVNEQMDILSFDFNEFTSWTNGKLKKPSRQSELKKQKKRELFAKISESVLSPEVKNQLQTLMNKETSFPSTDLYKKKRNDSQVESQQLSDAELTTLYEQAKTLHELGVKGNKKAAQKALELWEKAEQANPTDATARTYHAASIALMARYAEDPQELFGQAIQGLKALKSALSPDQDHVELRLLRGNIYFSLPEGFFRTSEKAVKDFKFVVNEYEKNPEQSALTKDQYLQVLQNLGIAYERTHFQHKAEKVWKKLLSQDTENKYKDFLESKGIE